MTGPDGEAKFWIEPSVELATHTGLAPKQLNELKTIILERRDESQARGKNTSEVEVTNVSIHGIWVYVSGTEYFLPYDKFPWFREASIAEIHGVELIHGHHLHWPELDVDLEIESLQKPETYPLKAK